jgi:hypothetical protein
VKFARELMGNFFIKNKLVRDTLVYQCLLYLGYALKVMKSDQFRVMCPDSSVAHGRLRVGIIGAGVMGKTLFELLHRRTLMGSQIG